MQVIFGLHFCFFCFFTFAPSCTSSLLDWFVFSVITHPHLINSVKTFSFFQLSLINAKFTLRQSDTTNVTWQYIRPIKCACFVPWDVTAWFIQLHRRWPTSRSKIEAMRSKVGVMSFLASDCNGHSPGTLPSVEIAHVLHALLRCYIDVLVAHLHYPSFCCNNAVVIRSRRNFILDANFWLCLLFIV